MVLPKSTTKHKKGPFTKILAGSVIVVSLIIIAKELQDWNAINGDENETLLSIPTVGRVALHEKADFATPDQLKSYSYDKDAPASFVPATKNLLEYVHITKTGGTAVEEAGAKAGISWGICHFELRKELGSACMAQDWKKDGAFSSFQKRNLFNGEWWHSPPAWLDPNPYQYAKSFTVVRNPYDRIISEYYCKYFGFHKGEYYGKLDRGQSNKAKQRSQERSEWMRDSNRRVAIGAGATNDRLRSRAELYQQRMQERHSKRGAYIEGRKDERRRAAVIEEDRMSGSRRLQDQRPSAAQRSVKTADRTASALRRGVRREDSPTTLNAWVRQTLRLGIRLKTGHTLPQHYYVYSDQTQVIAHVLHYENLHAEFQELMEQYGLDATLPEKKTNAGHESTKTVRLTADDLSPETIALINQFYAEDFELFGYDMMQS